MAGPAYRVTPRDTDGRGGNWQVIRTGASRAYSTHDDKNIAVREAKKVARRQRTGLVVHRGDGTVQYGYKCDTSGSRAKLVKTS